MRTGVEFDSNAYRTGSDEAVGDFLTRYFAVLEGELEGADDATMTFGLRQGGKLFFREPGSDALLTQANLHYRHPLSGAVWAIFDADLKDRLERTTGAGADVPHQDYNRGGARAGFRVGPVTGRATAGWRYFAFRPNPASSSHGPQGALSVSARVHRNLRLRARYGVSHRNFQSIRFVRRRVDGGEGEETVVQRDRSGDPRRDLLHIARIGGTYRGPFILEASYVFLANASNSYGQAMRRHGLEIDATAPLPWKLYLSARLQLQRTNYEDPLFLSADLRVDEENRNAAVVSLTRVIGEHWEVEGRYRLFLEEFGVAGDYRRQTGFVGVGYVF